ncbi:ABC-2 type transporter-domain-containing protein [Aspergillus karnatakaensis]|uniref:pleiotropic drug resistance family ABC transporter n=1 Tax=Aspergillus karnatakaensis TaxID=1810916 RepID=UPI003CCDB0B1
MSSQQPQPPAPFGAVAATAAGQHAIDAITKTTEENPPSDSTKEKADSSDITYANSEKDIDHASEQKITALARNFSRISQKSSVAGGTNTFLDASTDPQLDPSSEHFNARKWTKNFLSVTNRDPDRYPRRTAGVSFRNLSAFGYGTAADYQADVANMWLKGYGWIRRKLGFGDRVRIDILRDFEGYVRSGEMLVVLGRPGSGCSTFLKTIAGETHGLWLDEGTDIQYQGISWDEMHSRFRGEVIYQAETEIHFPQLTAGETLHFAARARAPVNRFPGVTRDQYATHMRDVTMAMLGLSHTMNTQVGNEFIRGVSGGERKRVSIAETILCGCPLQCWDNSTRGLDSSTALEFVRNLRLSTEYTGSTAVVAIYQASQAIYDVFDKAIVLYEGRMIYFGDAIDARRFFIEMGFDCPDRQTTADFLTSLTSPTERLVRKGFEGRVPRTPDEFAARWKASTERKQLLEEIGAFQNEYPIGGSKLEEFNRSRAAEKAKGTRAGSPYTLSYPMQIRLCLSRGFIRLKGDMSMTLATTIGNSIMALIISSVFYNLSDTTEDFFSRGALLFFSILLNAFSSALEILTLWQQRPIVEKHYKYALYHPSAEAISSMIVDLPAKVLTSIVFNLILYFMTNLRRTPGHFFIFYLFSFTTTLTMSNIFRWIGAISRSMAQAMVPSSLFMLALVIYTGFTVPVRDMRPWFRWINYINPIAYAFESVMVNEFSDRTFPCWDQGYVPGGEGYADAPLSSKICSGRGAVPGQDFIDGDAFINVSYEYYKSHLWRNYGIILAFLFFFLAAYIISSELVRAKPSKGEILVFPRGKIPAFAKEIRRDEEVPATEKATAATVTDQAEAHVGAISKQTAIFHWQDVCYDIKIKGENRRILNHVDGWVKPGTLTALMGVTGAGKTSLLDVLADRVTMGVITGEMLVDGRLRDDSFQRKTGYVQQQDLHLETSTVREALIFSAMLRQPASISRKEKIAYVDEVIKMLGMEEYAEAIVGILGEGLNVEQRKRLTIGVELAAKPDLLLFFDEPTSGLDSQTAWSICSLMRKLADHGQAILCTIHQPSAILMQQFDRLLFLAKGGKTIYFGELGDNMETLIKYFEAKGSVPCPKTANPAEWMLEVIGAAPGSHADRDWAEVWSQSSERDEVQRELVEMKAELLQKPAPPRTPEYGEFAMPLWSQFLICLQRMLEQYWRSPSYIYSKAAMCIIPTLFIGFTFWREPVSLQGMQNQMFAIFMLLIIFPNLVQQMMPYFCTQRALYEVRERPSKAYSWKAFMMASICVELPWNILMAIPAYFAWYYPIGLYRNAEDDMVERGGTMFLLILIFMLFASTFSSMIIAGIEHPDTGSNIAQLLFSLCLVFNGVLATPSQLPGFWIFMYRVSPFTYLVSSVLSTGLRGAEVHCSDIEVLSIPPPSGESCTSYLGPYLEMTGGRLLEDAANGECRMCATSTTEQYLDMLGINPDDLWRNVGILFVYVVFNAVAAVFLYWLVRVPKKKSQQVEKKTQ